MKKNAAYWQNMAEFGVSVQKDLVADLTASRQEAERLREALKAIANVAPGGEVGEKYQNEMLRIAVHVLSQDRL